MLYYSPPLVFRHYPSTFHIRRWGTTWILPATSLPLPCTHMLPVPLFFQQSLNHNLKLTLFSSVQFSRSVVSDSLRPHELQHARPPCPSPTPGVHPNSCPSSLWCHPAVSSSVVPFSSCPQSLPASESFSNESALRVRWPKYWSFSFSIIPSKEHQGLISFRMDWLDLLEVQEIIMITYILFTFVPHRTH